MKSTIWITVVAVGGLHLGCDDKGRSAAATGRVALPEGALSAPPVIGHEAERALVEGGTERAAPARSGEPERAGARSFAAELGSVYSRWKATEKALLDDFSRALEGAIAKEAMFAQHLAAIYRARQGRPVMSRDGLLHEDADALVQAIQGVASHGLDPAPYELDRLATLLETFARGRLEADQATGPGEDKALWQFVLAHRKDGIDEVALASAAVESGLGDGDLARLSEAHKRLDALLAGRKALNATLAELDAFLLGKLHRWVFDMRFYRKAHPFHADRSEAAGLERVAPDFEKVMAIDLDREGAIAALVQSVVPRFPDYEPTREALARYRGYAAKYPEHLELAKEVERLGKGKSGDAVRRLEERLIQEEYLQGPPTGAWSGEIEEALMEYQETHQMKPTGKVDRLTRLSLNTTFAERERWVALSLQRYRESDLHQGAYRFGEVPVRARVNIPAMEARFYLGTELARRHRVVVGNNDVETDGETGKKGKLNQTRLLTAEMSTIVLNPVWNVPKRIKEQELDLMLMDEPDYYEKHNFKVQINPDGTERVVQQPGPGNALGLVKFLFPNQFAIYMHDTPKKKLFDRPVRAFSHGCMRTENPLDLARWILVEVDKEMTNEQFDEVLAAREERHFAINPKIPISTDYVTTTIDEAGRIVFLADVYQFDKAYYEGQVPFRNDRDLPMTVVF